MTKVIRTAIGSVVIACLVLSMKLVAWWVTGSVALLADALESVVNVTAAVAALVALHYAALPPDANHPYGHTKAEYFSAVLEGALIVLAAFSILHEAYGAWMRPRLLTSPDIGLAVSAAATVVNLLWALLLARRGRAARSPALLADSRHLMADVVTSIGVIGGVAAAALTGHAWFDPLLAALTAVNILWSGWGLMKASFSGLMDEAVPDELLARIRRVVAANAEGAIEAHDLRTRHAGTMIFLDFHLVVPGDMTVNDSHEICDRIEAALKAEVHGAVISIHVEPEGKAKHHGVLVL